MGWAQSLITTTVWDEVDPYVHLADALKRIDTHLFSRIGDLTRRRWERKLANQPLRTLVGRSVG